jgi:hypothetical protein
MHQGLPCSNDGLHSSTLGACGPPNPSCSTISSFEKTPIVTGPTCDDDARLLIKWTWLKNIRKLAPDKGYYSTQYFCWIDLEFMNPIELVSWFLELWTGRYDFSEFKPKLKRKEFYFRSGKWAEITCVAQLVLARSSYPGLVKEPSQPGLAWANSAGPAHTDVVPQCGHRGARARGVRTRWPSWCDWWWVEVARPTARCSLGRSPFLDAHTRQQGGN